ncbi:uncharacterized protein A4U43_C05F31590 [Asparagus officinalis]|uniref:Uncharacterized protein n=1 Tax=Asparagus officinalis TaxID=4686 RepID=A0A5P1F094_ASPOF|nr:uncharacterized protein A4U43_C05F31590 [Asparagus officinalis]
MTHSSYSRENFRCPQHPRLSVIQTLRLDEMLTRISTSRPKEMNGKIADVLDVRAAPPPDLGLISWIKAHSQV